MQMWSLHPECENIIESSWNIPVVGCPMFVLSKKLKNLKLVLKEWNKETFGNVQDNVRKAEDALNQIQMQIVSLGYSDALSNQEKIAQTNLDLALQMEEVFWKGKSRVKWHAEGDRNTKYFHRVAKMKNSTKLISSLRHDNTIITDQEQIADHIVNHYTNLFSSFSVLQDSSLIQNSIPQLVTEQANNLLTMIPSEEEIYNVVINLNRDSAPGPDGFGAFFYHTYWGIIKKEVISAVLQFFTDGWILPNFNSNTLVLIPKNTSADTVDQFRPIAIANFKHKIITKVLADRLAKILPNIVSQEQRAFIHGRNIKDCICLTSEAINLMQAKAYGGNLAMKVDIAKAFDTLDWKFLINVLRSFGFSNVFCDWILVILKSASISVSVNGKQRGYFHCKRGVR